MTAPPQKPGPAPASPYTALHGAHAAGPSDGVAARAPVAGDAESSHLAAETERLGALKGALWASFQAAPMSPVRAPIVDLTMAYTDALRLELKLRASAKEQRSAAAKALAKSGVRSL